MVEHVHALIWKVVVVAIGSSVEEHAVHDGVIVKSSNGAKVHLARLVHMFTVSEGGVLEEVSRSVERGKVIVGIQDAVFMLQLGVRVLQRQHRVLRIVVDKSWGLERARCWCAELGGTDLGWAHLNRAALIRAHLKGEHFGRAGTVGGHLEWTHMVRAQLERAHMVSIHLQQVDLVRSHLQRAEIRSHLEGSQLSGGQLNRADLVRAHVQWARMSRAVFSWTGASRSSPPLSIASIVLGTHIVPTVSLLHVLLAVTLSLRFVCAAVERAGVHAGSGRMTIVDVTLVLLLGRPSKLVVLASFKGALEWTRVRFLMFPVEPSVAV